MLRRILSYQVSVEAMIEFVVWALVPYISIGAGWAFFHMEQVELLQAELNTRMPAGSELAAYLTTAAVWPWELIGVQIYVG